MLLKVILSSMFSEVQTNLQAFNNCFKDIFSNIIPETSFYFVKNIFKNYQYLQKYISFVLNKSISSKWD